MLTTGQTLSHYRILERIGAGGMGEVWRALDTRLDRTVALKVLPPEAVRDRDRRGRFIQEAKAASALDHPNIVVVHDIGEDEGVHFIAMQYVSGTTLRERVGRMKLSEALGYAIQMADALAAAHAHGIVHRDLKPENVVVTEQGVAKILDFGVAKLTELGDSEEAPTRDQNAPITREGHVVGTAGYMSPEQAEGRKVDARSDIFSFGSVLYEMVSGERAFEGTSVPAVLASVLKDEPKSLSARMPEAPLELERILARALRKEPGRRFQSISELKIALEDLRSEVDSGVAISASVRRAPRRGRVFLIAAGGFAVVLGGIALWKMGATTRDSLPAPRVVPLTSAPGFEMYPSLSPDGRQVAFATERDLYVKLIDGGQELRLTNNQPGEMLIGLIADTIKAASWNSATGPPAWSPDGSRIAFIRHVEEEGEVRDGIFVISALGGPEKRLGTSIAGGNHGLSWSRDAQELAVVSAEKVGDVQALYLLSVETGEMRKLTNPPRECSEQHLAICGDTSPTYSPGGREIAFIRLAIPPAIYTIKPATGELKKLHEEEPGYFQGFLTWAADGESLVYSHYFVGTGLQRVNASKRTSEPIDFVGVDATQPTISRQGNRLAYVKTDSDRNVWKIPGPRGPKGIAPEKLIASTRDDYDARYSPDGKRIVFRSNRSGVPEVWISDADGGNVREPFQVLSTRDADWSPDGKQLVFSQNVDSWDLFIGSLEGGSIRRLTLSSALEFLAGFSMDGRWVYYVQRENAEATDQIFRVPAAGGKAVPVSRANGESPFEGYHFLRESPDGKYLFYTWGDETGIWRLPIEGGAEEKLLETRVPVYDSWDVFSGGVCYLESFEAQERQQFLRCHDLATDEVADVATLQDMIPPYITVSRDGEWILLNRQDASGTDLMLVENFR